MRLHGLRAPAQREGDLLRRVAFHDQLRDLPLARAQEVQRAAAFLPGAGDITVQQLLRKLRAEVRFAPHHDGQRLLQFLGSRFLQEIPRRTRLQCPHRILLPRVDRKHDDLHPREVGGRAPGRLDAVEFRHGGVHQHHVRGEGRDLREGFPAVRRFAQDENALHLFEQSPQARANQPMVVRQYHTNFLHLIPLDPYLPSSIPSTRRSFAKCHECACGQA